MENGAKADDGICVVSFDGGGPGSMSQLRILDEFMLRLAFKPEVEVEELRPADYFDLMGGVGFGGFVALLLGRLHMTTIQAMEELATIGTETFPKGDDMVTSDVNMARLRQAIENMLERNGHSVDIKLRDSSDNRCKVVVFAATTAVMDHCHPFRTYRSRQRCLDCTFVDAACATIATPEYFSSVAIGPKLRVQHFAGIPHGFDNPMRKVLKEAQLTFGEQKPVSLMLSLGSGPRPRLSDPDHHATRLCRIRYDGVASDLRDQLHEVGEYLRLNVDREMEIIELDAWHDLGSIESYTNVYLEMSLITDYIDRACQWLLRRSGSVTLGQLSGTSTRSAVMFHSQTLKDYLGMEFKQMHNIVQELGIERITLVDAIGNHIPIPLQFCLSYTMLSEVISVYFKHQKAPGRDFVERGDYRLVQGSHRSIVGPAEWTSVNKVGLMVEMSVILRMHNEDDAACPTCQAQFEKPTAHGWAQCLSCSGQFQIETHIQAEPQAQSTDMIRSEDNQLLEPSMTPVGSDHNGSGGAVKPKFRLISVINLLEPQPSAKIDFANTTATIPPPLTSDSASRPETYLTTDSAYFNLPARPATYSGRNWDDLATNNSHIRRPTTYNGGRFTTDKARFFHPATNKALLVYPTTNSPTFPSTLINDSHHRRHIVTDRTRFVRPANDSSSFSGTVIYDSRYRSTEPALSTPPPTKPSLFAPPPTVPPFPAPSSTIATTGATLSPTEPALSTLPPPVAAFPVPSSTMATTRATSSPAAPAVSARHRWLPRWPRPQTFYKA